MYITKQITSKMMRWTFHIINGTFQRHPLVERRAKSLQLLIKEFLLLEG